MKNWTKPTFDFETGMLSFTDENGKPVVFKGRPAMTPEEQELNKSLNEFFKGDIVFGDGFHELVEGEI